MIMKKLVPRNWMLNPPPKLTHVYNNNRPASRQPIDSPTKKVMEKRKDKITLPEVSILKRLDE